MSKLSGAMWHHIPNPSLLPKWIPVDTRVSEGYLSIESLCSLSTQSIWRNIRSDSSPNIASLLLSQMEKHSHYKKSVNIKYSSFKDMRIWFLIFQILESLKSQVALYLLNAKLVTVQSSFKFARPHSSCSQSSGLPT